MPHLLSAPRGSILGCAPETIRRPLEPPLATAHSTWLHLLVHAPPLTGRWTAPSLLASMLGGRRVARSVLRPRIRSGPARTPHMGGQPARNSRLRSVRFRRPPTHRHGLPQVPGARPGAAAAKAAAGREPGPGCGACVSSGHFAFFTWTWTPARPSLRAAASRQTHGPGPRPGPTGRVRPRRSRSRLAWRRTEHDTTEKMRGAR